MADEKKRIINETTDTALASSGDYVIVDSQTEGTRKFDLGAALAAEVTARDAAIAAEASARSAAVSAEATTRAEADTAINGEITQLKEDLTKVVQLSGESLISINDFSASTGVAISPDETDNSITVSTTSAGTFRCAQTPITFIQNHFAVGKSYRFHVKAEKISGNPTIRFAIRGVSGNADGVAKNLLLNDGGEGFFDFVVDAYMRRVTLFITWSTSVSASVKFSDIWIKENVQSQIDTLVSDTDRLESSKEYKHTSATFFSDTVRLGSFDANGVFTEATSGQNYGSDYAPCIAGVPIQYITNGIPGTDDFWLRFYYYDSNKQFISRSDSFNMTNNAVANDTCPQSAAFVRLGFSYANGVWSIAPYTLNVGKIYETRELFLLDKSIITIAAYNSTYGDKMTADIVCDGVNDEVELQRAINILQANNNHKGGKIILLNGTYIIDTLYDSGSSEVGKIGLMIKNTVTHSPYGSITIEGNSIPNLTSVSEVGSCAVIRLSDTCFNALTDSEKVSIIGGLPALDSNNQPPTVVSCTGSWLIKNIGIAIQNPYKSVIGINAEWCWSLQLSNIQMARTSYRNKGQFAHEIVNANEECIGLRTVRGLNNGAGYQIENVNVRGWGTGFDISGEHMTMIGCCARINKTGYRFGYFDRTAQHSAHPNVLINCCDEVCMHGIKLYGGILHPTIEFISYNRELDRWVSSEDETEVLEYQSYATEEIPGNYHGRVTYAIDGPTNYGNREDIDFWDDGSGINFVTVNMMSPTSGTTANRPTHPQKDQMYFDTTINKAIYYINGNWVDANGNQV